MIAFSKVTSSSSNISSVSLASRGIKASAFLRIVHLNPALLEGSLRQDKILRFGLIMGRLGDGSIRVLDIRNHDRVILDVPVHLFNLLIRLEHGTFRAGR